MENNEPVWENVEVTLERRRNGLGLYIAGGDAGTDVSISRFDVNGSANADGRLRIGDILVRVRIRLFFTGCPFLIFVA